MCDICQFFFKFATCKICDFFYKSKAIVPFTSNFELLFLEGTYKICVLQDFKTQTHLELWSHSLVLGQSCTPDSELLEHLTKPHDPAAFSSRPGAEASGLFVTQSSPKFVTFAVRGNRLQRFFFKELYSDITYMP